LRIKEQETRLILHEHDDDDDDDDDDDEIKTGRRCPLVCTVHKYNENNTDWNPQYIVQSVLL